MTAAPKPKIVGQTNRGRRGPLLNLDTPPLELEPVAKTVDLGARIPGTGCIMCQGSGFDFYEQTAPLVALCNCLAGRRLESARPREYWPLSFGLAARLSDHIGLTADRRRARAVHFAKVGIHHRRCPRREPGVTLRAGGQP